MTEPVSVPDTAADDLAVRIDQASALYKLGKLAEAESAFTVLCGEVGLSDAQRIAVHLGLAQATNQIGRRDDTGKALEVVERLDPENADAATLRMQVEFGAQRYDGAIAAADKVTAARPDHYFGYYIKALATFHKDRKNPESQKQAIGLYEKAAELAPRNHNIIGALAAVVGETGDEEYVRALGQEVLYRKDKEVRAAFARSANKDVTLKKVDRPFDPLRRQHNIIAFSVFGDDPMYLQGAIANAEIAPYLYPEWTCRFYVDPTVPAEITARLKALRAEVVVVPEGNKHWNGTFWRFRVSDDPSVDRFLIRDVDSRLNVQERVAVEEWLASGKAFHVMRDNMAHREMILAGMWGGVAGVIPDMEGLYRRKYFEMAKPHADQLFLKDVIWPLIREETVIHDSFYRFMESRDYPKYGKLPWNLHIGCGFKTTKAWFWYWP